MEKAFKYMSRYAHPSSSFPSSAVLPAVLESLLTLQPFHPFLLVPSSLEDYSVLEKKEILPFVTTWTVCSVK